MYQQMGASKKNKTHNSQQAYAYLQLFPTDNIISHYIT